MAYYNEEKAAAKALTVADTESYVPSAAAFVKNITEAMAAGDVESAVSIRNANINSILDLKEFQAKAEFAISQINDFLYNICSIGEDSLPKNIKFSKQSFTTTFSDPHAAAMKLIEAEGTPLENFLNWITPKQAAEAAGITDDRLRATIGEFIVDTPKKRTLSIKA